MRRLCKWGLCPLGTVHHISLQVHLHVDKAWHSNHCRSPTVKPPSTSLFYSLWILLEGRMQPDQMDVFICCLSESITTSLYSRVNELVLSTWDSLAAFHNHTAYMVLTNRKPLIVRYPHSANTTVGPGRGYATRRGLAICTLTFHRTLHHFLCQQFCGNRSADYGFTTVFRVADITTYYHSWTYRAQGSSHLPSY